MASGYFFFGAACLDATACFFLRSAVLTSAFFCVVFFWFDFGDLSPITFIFFYRLTHLRHVSFSAGRAILSAMAIIVNAAREIIWRPQRQDAEDQPAKPRIAAEFPCPSLRSDGRDGLVEPIRAGVGVEQHAGSGVLCAGLATGADRGNQPPLVSNPDQGSQFTSAEYVGTVAGQPVCGTVVAASEMR